MRKLWFVRLVAYVAVIVGVSGSVLLVSGREAVPPPAEPETAWAARIRDVERAIASGDVSLAIYRWRDAYGEAWRSRRWEALVAVGDAALLIDKVPRNAEEFRHEARRAYLAALFRARSVGSDEGVRRAADAFGGLGDTGMAEDARAMASSRPAQRAQR